MDGERTARIRERLFRVSVLLKGLDSVLEIVGGVLLLVVSPDFILRLIGILTQGELAEDPRDLVANYVLNAARHLSIGTEYFAALYLLGHGVIKVLMVAGLLQNRLWAYPVAVVVFAGFILYQLYRFTFTHAVGLIALSIFDLFLIAIIWLEYRAQNCHAA